MSESTSGADATAGAVPAKAASWFDRRLLQTAGVYLAGAWTFFQFVQWLVNRYVLSPYLVDACLLLLILLLPTVLVLSHAGERYGGWSRLHTVGIPCNIVGALLALGLLFGGKDLGSAQETVTLTDAAGNTVERTVPKSAFRKRVVLFYVDNATGDATHDWVRHGISEALWADLSQDPFMVVTTQGMLAERTRRAGFESGFGLPLALQRQLAEDARMAYAYTGTLRAAGPAGFQVETRLYRADNGQVVANHQYEGPDLLALVDAMSLQVRRDLEVPARHIEDTIDLPVSELLTADLEALRAYAEAEYANTFGQDAERAHQQFSVALERDPTFAYAYVGRGQLRVNQSGFTEGLSDFRQAQRYDFRLTERIRYALDSVVLLYSRQPEEALQAALQWTTLYPEDTEGLEFIASLYRLRGEIDQAVAARRKILELDPSETEQLLTIGTLFRERARLDEAEQAYRSYIEQVPDDADGHRQLGLVLGRLGDLDGKMEAYRRALALEPDDISAMTSLAFVHMQQGAFEEAETLYRRAIAQSRTPRERFAAESRFAKFYHAVRGQSAAFLDGIRAAFETQATFSSAPQLAFSKAMSSLDLAKHGAAAEARQALAAAKAGLADELNIDLTLAEAFTLSYLGEAVDVEALFTEIMSEMETLGADVSVCQFEASRGSLYQNQAQWADAEAAFERCVASDPSQQEVWTQLGTVRLMQEDLDGAAQAYTEALAYYPAHPDIHLGLAKTAHARGDVEAARRHLARALEAWVEADTTYEPAAEARALSEALGGV
ncbi:MAG: tetratricopeptide repeat protein [Bacteroidota bacterium]